MAILSHGGLFDLKADEGYNSTALCCEAEVNDDRFERNWMVSGLETDPAVKKRLEGHGRRQRTISTFFLGGGGFLVAGIVVLAMLPDLWREVDEATLALIFLAPLVLSIGCLVTGLCLRSTRYSYGVADERRSK